MALFGVIFGVVIPIAAAVGCVAVTITVGKHPRSRRYVIQAVILGVLAGLAPISSVIFLRLSGRACVVLNVLGLPWAEPWREIAHWGAGAIWLASTAFIVVALTRPQLRRAGVAMLIWSVASVVPTFLLLFLVLYGDPAAGCVPV